MATTSDLLYLFPRTVGTTMGLLVLHLFLRLFLLLVPLHLLPHWLVGSLFMDCSVRCDGGSLSRGLFQTKQCHTPSPLHDSIRLALRRVGVEGVEGGRRTFRRVATFWSFDLLIFGKSAVTVKPIKTSQEWGARREARRRVGGGASQRPTLPNFKQIKRENEQHQTQSLEDRETNSEPGRNKTHRQNWVGWVFSSSVVELREKKSNQIITRDK